MGNPKVVNSGSHQPIKYDIEALNEPILSKDLGAVGSYMSKEAECDDDGFCKNSQAEVKQEPKPEPKQEASVSAKVEDKK